MSNAGFPLFRQTREQKFDFLRRYASQFEPRTSTISPLLTLYNFSFLEKRVRETSYSYIPHYGDDVCSQDRPIIRRMPAWMLTFLNAYISRERRFLMRHRRSFK